MSLASTTHRRRGRQAVRLVAAGLTALALAAPLAARADLLWALNAAALEAGASARQLPTQQGRNLALLNLAIFDAVNAIEARYRPYLEQPVPGRGASPEAAASAAGHAVLVALFPERRAAWDQLQAEALEAVADPRARSAGVEAGERAAAALLAHRAADGSSAPGAYRPLTTPGRYVPTALPVSTTWGRVTPWAMRSCDQLRPPPPPALDGDTWRRDYQESRSMGGKSSESRTPAQTEVARFWSPTGPATAWPIVRALAVAPGRTLLQNARLLAMASIAFADASVSVFDAKYAYAFWRPITAIRNGGALHEPLAEEASWEPLVETPMHPEYPCAHCIHAAAVVAVLEAEFGSGPHPGLEMTSAAVPGVVHRWATLRDWQNEVASARIWGGVHFRNSTEVGADVGRRIGALATERLAPLEAKGQEASREAAALRSSSPP